MKRTQIIILVGLAIFMVALAMNLLTESASIYTDFATAEKATKDVHIVGEWVQRDQAHYDPSQDLFSFYMKDTLQKVELVHYHDPKPMNFEQAEKVVIIGGYRDNADAFVAEKIVMKCPSKYEETDITAGEKTTL
ncbi:MAG: cytochrome c maturation protein CcmE [Bacteroidota bacterium]